MGYPLNLLFLLGVLFCYKTGNWNDVVTDLVVELTNDDDYDDMLGYKEPNNKSSKFDDDDNEY